MTARDLADLSLVDAVDAVAMRETTSMALLEACLARLDAAEERINATIWLDREGAFRAAEAADKAVAAGAALGLLHGLPLAHKDMYYQAGRPCTCGSVIRKDFVPTVTATVVERMAAAGAYAYGGLNMAEFAMNPTGHNAHYGDCHNPWNLPYITGGSSSGSGAAVASRCTYGALGSDTGGSIRLPAAACGVTGLKPTQTRVSRAGVMPLSFSADNVGPLTRTVRDCARMMKVIAGQDSRDPTSSAEPVPDYEAALDGDLRGLRVGIPTTYFLDGADAPVVAAFEAAVAVLAGRGATVMRLPLPLMDAVSVYAGVLLRVEAAAIHAEWMRERPQDYSVQLSARLFGGNAIPAPYYVEALSRRGPILKAFADEVFGQVDVLATPTIRTCLPTLAETNIDQGSPASMQAFMAVSANTRPFNYLGLPAISVNCGFDPNGCPIGLQIAGRPFAEARVMTVADAYQRDTDWHTRQPPL
ncbi:Amidase [Gluconacetobacter diazotrophicus PA1 5]|uniref:Asp-tRNA(Asn)/Glu-tRNA(Gln) amidotransferase GatCAB subunit A n=1 Tax=Gluconacetobacter diazotrophicus TaxID=33996 RepID=A0A7W4NGS4_GLUDI|nr:Asp-tRNA(Asn)/Glu-tRNA(Gln) amidotransferase GatCAB subunit A [Gluconacetobacter diazotrophicus]ACI52020.1 Amidase [Gluconacetobacter diazotrophicus PA1 5]MBB2157469.1 Asp-tRNA(Asn)/Glu-tRNA(Gln) amidotransferase GatCAB subunit A [Gluconacetobacter diazotrophicus]TWB05213.1 aspartyl/glutamyl-tRNA(Asn/Gln) amidotransferase subunit A [Gluconacetobacter diazotrophicus]